MSQTDTPTSRELLEMMQGDPEEVLREHTELLREIRDAARDHGLPVYFKQSADRYNERGKALVEENMTRTVLRELPALPDALADARPDLAAEVVA